MIIAVKSIGNGITRYNAGESIKVSAFGIGHGAVSVDNKNVASCIVSACNIYTGWAVGAISVISASFFGCRKREKSAKSPLQMRCVLNGESEWRR